MYNIKPYFMDYRELPVPVVINGIASKDFPLIVYWLFYLDLSISGFIIVGAIIPNQLFFIVSILFMANQLEAIADILQLLNYEGVRDRQRDKWVIRESYLLHVDILK